MHLHHFLNTALFARFGMPDRLWVAEHGSQGSSGTWSARGRLSGPRPDSHPL